MSDTPVAVTPLYNIHELVATVDGWAKRHRIKRLAANEVGIALEKVCDAYEVERRQLSATIATQAARIAALEQEVVSLCGDDWGKTVDYLMAHAPEPEPSYDVPEPPEGWDDEEGPHYDTPGGY